MNNPWIEIGRLEEIPRQGGRVVKTTDGDIALFRAADDAVYAVRNRCPHKGGPLVEGIVCGATVTCPLHNWRIDLHNGQAVAPDRGQVATYPVRVEDGVILLGLGQSS